jgi:hypothetical protein
MKQLFIALCFVVYATQAAATDWYADNSRPNDSATCTQAQTKATAKKTIEAALACVGFSAGAGANDRVIVVAGTYTGAGNDSIGAAGTMPSGTSWNAPFTLMAENSTQNDSVKGPTGDLVIVRSAPNNFDLHSSSAPSREDLYAIIQGFTIDGSITTGTNNSNSVAQNLVRFTNNDVKDTATNNAFGSVTGSNLEFLNNKIHGGAFAIPGGSGGDYGYAIYASGANMLFARNEVYSIPSWGIHLFSQNDCPDGATIHSNVIHDFGFVDPRGVGIMLCGDNHTAYNNVVYRGSTGISTFRGHTGNRIFNNTVHSMSVGIGLQSGQTGLELKNNILSNNATNIARSINPDSFATNGNQTNYCTTTGGNTDCQLLQSVVGAIRLVDPANGDFRPCLEAGNPHANCGGTSPVIDAGITLSTTFTVDIVSTARPVGSAWDIGAYEAGNTSPVEPTPALVLQISCDNVVTDSSGNANDGTLGNGASITATGKYNQGCRFDGINDTLTINDSNSLDLTHGFTLEGWVKPVSVANDALLIGKNPSLFYLFSSITGYCGTSAVMGGFSTSTTTFYACYSTPLTPGVYTYLTVTYNRSLITLGINGVAVTTTVATAFIPTNTSAVQIGSSTFGEFLNGDADEFRIYNYARSFLAGSGTCDDGQANVKSEVQCDMDTSINTTEPPIASVINFKLSSSSGAFKAGANSGVIKVK